MVVRDGNGKHDIRGMNGNGKRLMCDGLPKDLSQVQSFVSIQVLKS